ncbi:hypothetical protein GCM10010218_26930 [Streptomyces mashuensis]|uniref:TrbL/VirB6 plasmid conjugal transfer protein n=1 Tax=Streptomyces mashuensis TaxID=33904 RepID=A0A919ECY4_9ACTN|nr:hypothetical protein [Streptomyces mashuensis]GHF44226.1 hypothetical protein GCM10010218_26930 [Streptomyces mashuensis]
MRLPRLPRFRNIAIPLLGALTTIMVTAGAAAADDDKYKKYNPAGIGDLLRTPRVGEGSGHTLYELYGSARYFRLDAELGWRDVGWQILQGIASLFMGLTVWVAQSAVVAVQWTLNFTDVSGIRNAITDAITGAGKEAGETLLPSALAVGALVAWANHRKANGSYLSQLGWVAAAGVLAVSLISTPGVWVDGIDSVRNVGSSVAMKAAAAGMKGDNKEPIAVDGADLGDAGKGASEAEKKNLLVRQASDAVWRSYVVTPWCIAEFGNLDTCKEFGQDVLKRTDKPTDEDFDDDRKRFLSQDMSDGKIGMPAMHWRQGKDAGRVTVCIAAFICALMFAVLAIALAFASLASLIGAMMLLLAGVVFACLWVIPGRPRQWGLRWFDALLGFALQSFVSTMVLGVVLVLNTVSIGLMGQYGYFAAIGVSITTAIVALKFRAVMESIVGVTGALSPGASAAGMALGRGASRLAGRATGWTARKTGRAAGWAGRKAGGAAMGAARAGAKAGARAFDDKVSHVGKAMGLSSWYAANAHRPVAEGGLGKKPGAGGGADGASAAGRGGAVGRAAAAGAPAGRTIATLPDRRTTAVGNVRPRTTLRSEQRQGQRQDGAGAQNAAVKNAAVKNATVGRTTRPANGQNGQTGQTGQQKNATGKSTAARRPATPQGRGQDAYRFRTAPRPHNAARQQRIGDARRAALAGGSAQVNRSGGAPAAPSGRRPRKNR